MSQRKFIRNGWEKRNTHPSLCSLTYEVDVRISILLQSLCVPTISIFDWHIWNEFSVWGLELNEYKICSHYVKWMSGLCRVYKYVGFRYYVSILRYSKTLHSHVSFVYSWNPRQIRVHDLLVKSQVDYLTTVKTEELKTTMNHFRSRTNEGSPN